MANTPTNNYLAITKWQKKFLFDYVQASGFARHMGADDNAIIKVVEDLKSGGETVVIPLVGQLRGNGVTGSQTLVGNEEVMGEFADRITVSLFRHGVSFTGDQTFRTDLDLYDAARSRLLDWERRKLATDISTALQSVNVKGTADTNGNTIDTPVLFATANATQKNGYLVANNDRILVGNNSAASKTTANGIWSTALSQLTAANSTTTNDKITSATLDTAREMALQTGLNSGIGIRPYMSNDDAGDEVFVYFCGPDQFRDLRSDTNIQLDLRHAADLGYDKNPLFRAGDMWHNGIIIRRCVDLGNIAGAGASGAAVGRGFLCGQQAVTCAYAQMPTPTTNVTDYNFNKGVGIQEVRGIKKTSFNGQNFGVVEVLSATTPSSF